MRNSPVVKGLSATPLINGVIVSVSLLFLAAFLLIPLGVVFYEAFSKGAAVWFSSVIDSETVNAFRLTIITALIAVPLNTVFGIAAAWALAKFHFFGRNLIITLIDIPFAVSPVIAGLLFVILFGSRGPLAPLLTALDIKVLFSIPGIVIATMFVTFPFIARELIPLMVEQGSEEEYAALTLGASGFKTFMLVTLPNVKWALLYGVILCNARAMGEFGAVSVVSGHIRGKTNTLPLHAEILYNEYNVTAAFAVSSLLTLLAVVTLIVKTVLEMKTGRRGERSV